MAFYGRTSSFGLQLGGESTSQDTVIDAITRRVLFEAFQLAFPGVTESPAMLPMNAQILMALVLSFELFQVTFLDSFASKIQQ